MDTYNSEISLSDIADVEIKNLKHYNPVEPALLHPYTEYLFIDS